MIPPPTTPEPDTDFLADARRRWPESPPWAPTTRLWVLTFIVGASLFVWWHVRHFTAMVVLAFLLTYIMHPVIRRTERRLRVNRSTATFIVYLALGVATIALGFLLARGVVAGLATVDPKKVWTETVAEVFQLLPAKVSIMGGDIALAGAYDELRRDLGTVAVRVFQPNSLGYILGFASTFAFAVFGMLVAFFTSLYLSLDGDRVIHYFIRKTPTAYRPVLRALMAEVDAVWKQFFRGQLVLAATVAVPTIVGLMVLGVRYALTLGIIAGVLEMVPRLGPVLSVVPAIAVALVHPSTTFPDLPRPVFVLLVAGLYIVVQQVENHVLVPRILGGSVNLPPAVMLVGALVFAAIGGVVGILLAAPLLGSIRVLGSWLYYQIVRPDHAVTPVEIALDDTRPPRSPPG